MFNTERNIQNRIAEDYVHKQPFLQYLSPGKNARKDKSIYQ